MYTIKTAEQKCEWAMEKNIPKHVFKCLKYLRIRENYVEGPMLKIKNWDDFLSLFIYSTFNSNRGYYYRLLIVTTAIITGP